MAGRAAVPASAELLLLPGQEAIQLAVYIGWLMHRTIGEIVAGVLIVLPALVAIMGLSWIYAI